MVDIQSNTGTQHFSLKENSNFYNEILPMLPIRKPF